MDSKALFVLVVLLEQILFSTQSSASLLREKRIVGGSTLPITRVPYQVALIWESYVVCGGSIIAPLWILTAAHCLYEHQDMDIRIRAGSDRRTLGGILRHMRWTTIHPQYSTKHLTNDVALILLDAPLIITSGIACVRMADPNHTPRTGQYGLVSGWGLTNPKFDKADHRSYSISLLYTFLPVIEFNLCHRLYSTYTVSYAVQFCAGYMEGGKDACTGDSGGPFTIGDRLVGVVSWGVSCAEPKHPGVFVKVGAFRGWIDGIMQRYSRAGGLKCSRYYDGS
ncbi:trypsin 3A1-like [Toxorhynchites rutilus septentrionalis]|uniref:trypsin 3A1-like n=1 Tax=Toxorhynchites rutilus septentrionalis TaxID=329112 RepID=UPI00247A6C40|nr:trypsin 3A1-like [Toxorhynchites rutilus septentrionalis]